MNKLLQLLSILPISILLLQAPNAAHAKKVRVKLKSPQNTEKRISRPNRKIQPLDSLTLADISSKIEIAGFEKNASSKMESFLITNNSGYAIQALELELTYSDLQGRMIHKRSLPIEVVIPQNETRSVSIKSFDQQKSLYYKKSTPPRSGGMPFDISIKILSVSAPTF